MKVGPRYPGRPGRGDGGRVKAVHSRARAVSIDAGSGVRIEVPLKSMKDLRDQKLVKQRFDYSCGAAALATILRYG